MPPHCDSLDGPVVRAARVALDAGEVSMILPYVHAEGEDEVRWAFDRTLPVRSLNPQAREVADRWFFETVVRIHRAGENAPFTGLKPAGLDVGPVIPLAERACADLSADKLADYLTGELRGQLERRVEKLRELASFTTRSLEDERRYVEASLGLQVFSHRLFEHMRSGSGH